MQVSVIIPVYNAAQFLEQSVASALAQPETAEVILIEDASRDDSYSLCQRILEKDTRVKLITHPGHENRGAGASRNLGIRNAFADFIAFLDADDIYLPSRFKITAEVFTTHPDAHAVYETIGTLYSDPSLKQAHLQRVGTELTGISQKVAPQDVFRILATGKHGHIHLNGLVIRKSVISPSMQFDTSLLQCQDSDFILRLSRNHLLYGGATQPVALRRVHALNRVLRSPEAIAFQRKFLRKCISSDFYGSQDRYANLYIIARYVSWNWQGRLRRTGRLSTPLIMLMTGVYLVIHPGVLYRSMTSHK